MLLSWLSEKLNILTVSLIIVWDVCLSFMIACILMLKIFGIILGIMRHWGTVRPIPLGLLINQHHLLFILF